MSRLFKLGQSTQPLRKTSISDNLYVGDSFYELNSKTVSTQIIFPLEGDWIDYMQSLRTLFSFVMEQNSKDTEARRVRIGCAHITSSADGEEIVRAVHALFIKIIEEKVTVVAIKEQRGEICDLWMEYSGARFSVRSPAAG
jgi:hypothetical protein